MPHTLPETRTIKALPCTLQYSGTSQAHSLMHTGLFTRTHRQTDIQTEAMRQCASVSQEACSGGPGGPGGAAPGHAAGHAGSRQVTRGRGSGSRDRDPAAGVRRGARGAARAPLGAWGAGAAQPDGWARGPWAPVTDRPVRTGQGRCRAGAECMRRSQKSQLKSMPRGDTRVGSLGQQGRGIGETGSLLALVTYSLVTWRSLVNSRASADSVRACVYGQIVS